MSEYVNNTNKKYRLYDEIVNATLYNLFNLSSEGNINIGNFDENDDNYNYILKVAFHVVALSTEDKTIYLDMGLFKYIKYKIKHRKYRIKRYKESKGELIDVPDLLNYMSGEFKVEDTIFKSIYKEYYK